MICEKVKHSSKNAMSAYRKINNQGQSVYLCNKCNHWHLGNSSRPDKRLRRMNQLFDRLKAER